MDDYFTELNNLPQNKIIKAMRKYAKTNKVPIINDDGLTLMLELVDLIKPKRFLEIGTAIGFCSICVALHNEEVIIDTIERDQVMYQEAINNISSLKLDSRINIFHIDALEIDLNLLHKEYDIIFIDAAKAQYTKFFEKFESLLSENGIIITDNLLFHGLVSNRDNIQSKNLKSLVKKIDSFNHWLKNKKDFKTTFLNIGDGIAISKRVKKK